ncbi:SDR family NAD(P)-dependent oxidoreductase [Photobacterium nomapromontoriensis]|uniref:SDR family NAD(P)-dependent oxidoreductase n=1 Tax=Photobacterium nomapromontoriensis TaxID=2910237 RepID=UPI003D0EFCE4
MHKTILLTGATDGIGLETAKTLVAQGHHLLLSGRNSDKLAAVEVQLSSISTAGKIETYTADLSNLADVDMLTKTISEHHTRLDVIINNAGIFSTPHSITADGLDVRFVVNTISPYLLTKALLSQMPNRGRVINVSSAAQSTIDYDALTGNKSLTDGEAYAQSKLAITMWSRALAISLGNHGPAIIAVNPASMLGSKMVKNAFGVTGGGLHIGADILCRAALSEEFNNANGLYFDNDLGRFSQPHPDAMDDQKVTQVVAQIEKIIATVQHR